MITGSPLPLGFCAALFTHGFGAAVFLDFRLLSFWCGFSAVRHIMKYSPFWWEIEQGLAQAAGEVNLPLEADYVIVGAGYTGLSAQRRLFRQRRGQTGLSGRSPLGRAALQSPGRPPVGA